MRPSRSGSELRTEYSRFCSYNIAFFFRTFVIFPTKTAACGGRNSSFSAPAGRGSGRKNHFLREKVCNIVRTKPDESTCQLSPTEGRSYEGSARTPVFPWGKAVEKGGGTPLPQVSVARGARLAPVHHGREPGPPGTQDWSLCECATLRGRPCSAKSRARGEPGSPHVLSCPIRS